MASSSSAPVVHVRGLNATLGEHHILQDLSFDVGPGEIVCIIGPNGSGKTTLVKSLLGLLPATGEMQVLGQPAGTPGLKIGYVPQRLDFDRSIPVTVRDLASFFTAKEDRNESHYRTCLGRVGIDHLLNQRLGALSGGEFQRVLMSLALHRNPDLLVLDEPVAGVDAEGETVIYDMLSDLRQKSELTTLLVSHDLSVVYRYATQVLCLNHRLVCHGIPREVLTADTLGQLYGAGAGYHHPERPHPDVIH